MKIFVTNDFRFPGGPNANVSNWVLSVSDKVEAQNLADLNIPAYVCMVQDTQYDKLGQTKPMLNELSAAFCSNFFYSPLNFPKRKEI